VSGVSLLGRLVRRFDLEQAGEDRYVGGAGTGGVTESDRLFGGLVAAQAAIAAARTASEFSLHSLHTYFLRPGRPDRDIEFRVQRAKQGRNFQVRNVEAWQNDQLILQMLASFSRAAIGPEHAEPMPEVPDPENLPNRDRLRGRDNWQNMPLDLRMATPLTGADPQPPVQHVWVRPNGPLPDDPVVHLGLLVFASDRTLLETAWRPHSQAGELAGASLDHSLWLHGVPCMDDWHLYTMHSPAAAAGRGLAAGAFYTRAGVRVCSVAQEGVLRLKQ
tara:strand:- start:1899 stop:2723 length:825 start_codon:yes stop_codon:yes gene_type:complete